MENNIYEIIQDWHELLKNDTINEMEFNLKKNELLNMNKIKREKQEKDKIKETIEFEKSKRFVNNTILYTILIICIGILAIYFYDRNNDAENIESEDYTRETIENETTLGNYIVQADSLNLVHFYEQPDISTVKKSYFSTNDTVYVSKIDNDFGYVIFVNSKGQKSTGWLKLEKMNYCNECENNQN